MAAGADWVDVGGVKAGPGTPVTEAEELDRVLPLIEAVRDRTDAVISVDTHRAEVAQAALAAGADVINDTNGPAPPAPGMARVAAESGATVIVTHSLGGPGRPGRPGRRTATSWRRSRPSCASACGSPRSTPASCPERIIIDPGP